MSTEEHTEAARRFLKADWAALETKGTDQTRGAPAPLLEKPPEAGARHPLETYLICSPGLGA